jgi:ribonuclease P/MRP protein subunit POP5
LDYNTSSIMVRFKNRYLVVEIIWETPVQQRKLHLTKDQILAYIKESIGMNFGEFGIATVISTLQVKYYNDATNICILRCPREQFRMVWGALTLITRIENEAAILRVIHVGGTLRSCQTQAIKFDRKVLHLLKKLKRISKSKRTTEGQQVDLPVDL